METLARIESALEVALGEANPVTCPPRLAEAIRYAVFPGGARIRPRICLAVAAACGDDRPELSDAAATAIELLHCASLVHDDLPCFDDANLRRGKPSVHRAFGERLAVLSGDALIVMAFEALARAAPAGPERLPGLVSTVGQSVSVPYGIVAGQAWECESKVDLASYQRAKTGALFAAATLAGAASAGNHAEAWRHVGESLGEAFQVADDIRDVASTPAEIGKPVGRDVALGRPSAARELGMAGAVAHLENLVESAIASIPPCPGLAQLRQLIFDQAKSFLPKGVASGAV